ncbi:MAG: hypothetical protein S4CHLAM81_04660 [Chlamydiales bacterium]|nr:hypothetical protein [Chlamydiales bacterium]MCH9635255.1 hypothetical protein [Chlamydiales bacterium]MCH9703460.1 hypothetical protein [Chlamydiota bacterium]
MNLTLLTYDKDSRIDGESYVRSEEHRFSADPIVTVHETVCQFFEVQQERNKTLHKAIFATDIQFNWYELRKNDSPDIIHGIKILDGDRNIAHVSDMEALEALDRGTRKIHMTTKSMFMSGDQAEWAFEDLQGHEQSCPAAVALYNSESYSSLTLCSTNLGTLLKYDIQAP